MKIAIHTDLHHGVRNDDDNFMNMQLRYYDELFFPYLEEHGITTVFNLGDTNDKRKIANIKTVKTFDDAYHKRLYDMGVTEYVLVGNHDVYYKSTNEINSIDVFDEKYDNVKVIDSFETVVVGGMEFAFMAWINNENYEHAMSFINNTAAKVVCGHFEFSGIDIGRGQVSRTGLNQSYFSKFDHVMSGHFHTPSINGNIDYIGNPFELTWADYGVPKGFIVYDTETRTYERIENPHRMFMVVDYDEEVDVINYDFTQYDNRIVKIRIKSFNMKDNAKFNLFMNCLQQHAIRMDVEEHSRITVKTDGEQSGVVIDDMEVKDTKTQIYECVQSIEMDGIENPRIVGMFDNLMEKVNESLSK